MSCDKSERFLSINLLVSRAKEGLFKLSVSKNLKN